MKPMIHFVMTAVLFAAGAGCLSAPEPAASEEQAEATSASSADLSVQTDLDCPSLQVCTTLDACGVSGGSVGPSCGLGMICCLRRIIQE
jgi:hypothetical protein